MHTLLNGIINRYGTEAVIARLMEQIHLLAGDGEPRQVAAQMLCDYPSDTEYIYALCEFTSLLTYASDCPALNEVPWLDKQSEREIRQCDRGSKRGKQVNEAGIHLLPAPGPGEGVSD